MGKKKEKEPEGPAAGSSKEKALQIRNDVQQYIRVERDTVLKKWMALEESLKAEDRRRGEFLKQKLEDDTRVIPPNIQKFIGTLKRAARLSMRHKGGTCYSVIRSLFLYWDADKSGGVSPQELRGITNSLGVVMTDAERSEVVKYYSNSTRQKEMGYIELLRDIQKGEPNIVAFVDRNEEDKKNENEIRFEEVTDAFKVRPKSVTQFVEIARDFVEKKLREEGGTPHHHIHHLFEFYDYDYSMGLNVNELMRAATKGMNLNINRVQAEEIIKYYDRKNNGQLEIGPFLNDVTEGTKSILYLQEFTAEVREQKRKVLAENPYIRRPFFPKPNKVLEKFRRDVKEVMLKRVREKAGSIKSWIRDAFLKWDQQYTKKMTDPNQVIGAAKILGVHLSVEDAHVLMKSYDPYDSGEMHYMILVDTLMADDPHFLDSVATSPSKIPSATSRTPPEINTIMSKIRTAAEAYAYKSKGQVNPRDILHGTFLRFDTEKTGHMTSSKIKEVFQELRLRLCEEDLRQLVVWFDSNGSGTLDCNALVRQIFGDDITLRPLILPKLGHSASGTITMSASGTLPTTMMMPGFISPINNNKDGRSQSFTLNKSSSLTASVHKDMMKSTAASERNLDEIESLAVKMTKAKARETSVLLEKAKLEERLASIEEQRKAIIEDYKVRHPKPKW